VTLFNCFVMGVIEDSLDSIFENLKQGALTMQQGGGVGYDFSTLRPRGTRARGVGAVASGPVSFMRIWDSMCGTILSTGARRGAMMATLRCDHPDIEEFIAAKQEPGSLRRFNLSVLVTDALMEAVERDRSWELVFPPPQWTGKGRRPWSAPGPGHPDAVPCRVLGRISARSLWDRLMRATYDYAEPGVLFVDRINRCNNLWYRERISATNPCGEIPLPPYGACDLGSINLIWFVRQAFTPEAELDIEAIRSTAEVATRLLDDVIDASRFPLPVQAEQAHGSRRIGMGITGLADALAMLGVPYGSPRSLDLSAQAMKTVCHAAYRSSVRLAQEKGSFPFLEREPYLEGPFIRGLPEDIRQGIAAHGIRNSHLVAIAPTGTISLLANNVSGGLEPIFDLSYERRVLNLDGSLTTFRLEDYAWSLWRRMHGPGAKRPESFVDAQEVSPETHVEVQAALQLYVDNSISKTVSVPESYPFDAFQDVYRLAYRRGLKGCTTFRPNPVTGAVLSGVEEGDRAPHCCTLEREAD
jgi:ribonucleoside-diphosphate reductase alpha chain